MYYKSNNPDNAADDWLTYLLGTNDYSKMRRKSMLGVASYGKPPMTYHDENKGGGFSDRCAAACRGAKSPIGCQIKCQTSGEVDWGYSRCDNWFRRYIIGCE